MPDLPKRLVQEVAAGKCVLFLGALIPGLVEEGGFPGPAELAHALAEHCGYPDPDRALARVAQYCQVTRGRDDLIAFLQAQLDAPAYEPAPIHRQVAHLAPPVIVTTCYDTLLERALREAQQPFVAVTGDQDISYADESRTLLIKMLGSIERGETLVITEDDYLDFTRRLPTLSTVLKAYFATRTLLFLCHDLEDPAFKRLYAEVTADLGQNARTAYAVLPAPTDYQARYWVGKALQVLAADPRVFLESLTTAAVQAAPPTTPVVEKPPPLTKRPFKFLDYYDTADADIFFGRVQEARDLAQLALSHRLVILTGASGTGKTSLVRAGVLPALVGQDCLAVVTRVGDDPAAAVVAALSRAVPELQLPADASIAPAAQAAEAQAQRLIVVFLDQFEEFFMRLGPAAQERFIAALAECLDDATLGTRFVLSLRSDFFVQLQAFKPRLPGIFHNTYEVQRLTPQQAQETIIGPLRAVGLDVEPRLVAAIVQDLDLGGVDPPQLQIVCDRLYQDAVDTGRRTLTIARYQELGRAERILSEYLDVVLARLPDADRALAREMLKALVTSRDTKDRLPLGDLTRTLAMPEAAVKRVADDLVAARLLRRTDEAYELVHDFLARRVREWLDEGERALKESQEVLRRQVDGWRARRLSLSRGEMLLVDKQRERLRPSDEELMLIAYSAVLHDVSAEVWLGRLADPTAALLLLLDDEDPVARRRAAARLGSPPSVPPIRGEEVGAALAQAALADEDPAVREAAARSLGALNDAAGLARLGEATRASETRRPAVAALAHARDVGAASPAGLDAAVRLRVLARLAGLRVWRDRAPILYQTLGGALGGAVGLGLGFALFMLFDPTLTPTQRLALPFMAAVLFSFPGLLAGGALGLLGAVGAALSPRRARAAHLVGAIVGGMLGYGVGFLLFGLMRPHPLQIALQALLAGWLLGAMIGGGVALPAGLTRRGWLQTLAIIGGGALGGVLAGLVLDLLGLLDLAGMRVATIMGAVIGGGVGAGLALAGAGLRRRAA